MSSSGFTFIDLFAGTGGFRIALESLGGDCVGSSEVDKNALDIYRLNWPGDPQHHSLGDIRNIKTTPAVDVLVGGVPCQSWSIAGRNLGIQDPRGQLWNEVIRLVGSTSPKAFIFENVKGLSDNRHRNSLQYLLDSFTAYGYDIKWKVLNSFDFGVPQDRERIFIVGHRGEGSLAAFQWPSHVSSHLPMSSCLDMPADYVHASPVSVPRNTTGARTAMGFNKLTPKGQKNKFFIFSDLREGPTTVHSWDLADGVSDAGRDICLALLRNRRKSKYGDKDGNPLSVEDFTTLVAKFSKKELDRLVVGKIIEEVSGGKYDFVNRRMVHGIDGVYRIYLPSCAFFPTLMASGTCDHVADVDVDGATDKEYMENFLQAVWRPGRFRKPSCVEMARLQGYPSTYKLHPKDSVNVKLLGNAITVPVVRAVCGSLLKVL